MSCCAWESPTTTILRSGGAATGCAQTSSVPPESGTQSQPSTQSQSWYTDTGAGSSGAGSGSPSTSATAPGYSGPPSPSAGMSR